MYLLFYHSIFILGVTLSVLLFINFKLLERAGTLTLSLLIFIPCNILFLILTNLIFKRWNANDQLPANLSGYISLFACLLSFYQNHSAYIFYWLPQVVYFQFVSAFIFLKEFKLDLIVILILQLFVIVILIALSLRLKLKKGSSRNQLIGNHNNFLELTDFKNKKKQVVVEHLVVSRNEKICFYGIKFSGKTQVLKAIARVVKGSGGICRSYDSQDFCSFESFVEPNLTIY